MSRIGKNPVSIPDGVEVSIVDQDNLVHDLGWDVFDCLAQRRCGVVGRHDDDGAQRMRIRPGKLFEKRLDSPQLLRHFRAIRFSDRRHRGGLDVQARSRRHSLRARTEAQ